MLETGVDLMRSRRRRHPQPRPHRASPQSARGGILKMFLCDTPEQAWVYINRVVEPPSRNLATLLSQYPVEKVAYGIYHQESWIGPVLGESAARRDWLRQQEDLDTRSEEHTSELQSRGHLVCRL